MARELDRVTLALLIAFGVIVLSAGFWTTIQGESLLARSDNARQVIADQQTQRGTIYDRNGERLAYTETDTDGLARRVYPYPEAVAAVGYYSFTYGTTGIENAYDGLLSGDALEPDAWDQFVDRLLHEPRQGADVLSTIDLDVQRAAVESLGDHSGAVIVVHVPSGRVLAMASLPGYDPNTLDQDWERLTRLATRPGGPRDPEGEALSTPARSPLLNRVTAGRYQPGGAFQTVMLAAILARDPDLSETGGYILNTQAYGAHAPVTVNGLQLHCLPDTPSGPLSLAESYLYGCPGPFVAALEDSLTPDRVWQRLDALGLLSAPDLPGFQTTAGPLPEPLSDTTPLAEQRAVVTGQGPLTVSPLQMVQMVAAIANQGNGIPLHTVEYQRLPDASDWTEVDIPTRRPAMLRVDVAEAVRLTMLQAAARCPYVQRAQRGSLVLYGHVALAYAGPQATPYSWFVGFVDTTQSTEAEAIAVVAVVENTPDPGAAADVAGGVFSAVMDEQ